MSGPLKALIVGCGRIAGGFDECGPDSAVLSHAGAYRRHSGFEIAACVEPDAERRQGFAKTWAVPAAFANLDQCLQAGIPFDVASVCVPTAHHGAVLERLLGTEVKAVFCEKPLTDDAAESERLVEAYAEAGVLLAVNYLRRWDPSVVALRHEIESGEWGQVRTATGYYTKGVLNNGSHLVDLAHLLRGPLALDAVTGARTDHDPGDPTVDAVLRWEDGVALHLIGADARDMSLLEFHMVTERGAIGIEESGFTIRRRRIVPSPYFAGYRQLDRGQWVTTELETALYRAVDNLYAAVVRGAVLESDGRSALPAQVLCEEMRRRGTSLELTA